MLDVAGKVSSHRFTSKCFAFLSVRAERSALAARRLDPHIVSTCEQLSNGTRYSYPISSTYSAIFQIDDCGAISRMQIGDAFTENCYVSEQSIG